MQMADAFFSSAEPNHCLPSSAGSGRVGSGPFSHSHGSAAQNRRQTRPPSLESRSASAIRATALLLLDPKGLVSPWRDQATFTDSGTALVNAHRPRPDASESELHEDYCSLMMFSSCQAHNLVLMSEASDEEWVRNSSQRDVQQKVGFEGFDGRGSDSGSLARSLPPFLMSFSPGEPGTSRPKRAMHAPFGWTR
ncbi:hypothetical protein AXG93_3235s1150 [Marchantia polymorpha subsp. ruderalis]|uniref:Uncharacterized protein n=1 Tax=Marchantia polymorpha subsp. ruderalis TaxID=1480154 RepID=A0A176WPR8_MARPO|nr:hypothetical protein AXG93_3235s1150 [Marchantia polymorpha subsp. ruderalis]